MHQKQLHTAGESIQKAKKALIMVHGRGATAEGILGLAQHLDVTDYALIAPQAMNHTWYPNSFLAPPEQNEPWLSSALDVLKTTLEEVVAQGIAPENIYFLGFSQGACLTLEFVARYGTKYGGVVAFTGGLIGDKIDPKNYSGDFSGTPFFISTGNPDPHVPVERIHESVQILEEMNASVQLKVYNGRPHSISPEEITIANEFIFNIT